MNLGTIVKLACGGFSAEEAVELARGMGWDLRYQDLMNGQRPLAFQRAGGRHRGLGRIKCHGDFR